MKRAWLFVLAWLAFPAVSAQNPAPQDLQQVYVTLPMNALSSDSAVNSAEATAPAPAGNAGTGTTIPFWKYTMVAYDGKSYNGAIVGRNPFNHGARTTNVPVVLIPVQIAFQTSTGTFSWDPTTADPDCLGAPPNNVPLTLTFQSPVLVPRDFSFGSVDMGITTYPDANQRGQFWQNVQLTGNSYHVAFNPVTTAPVQTASFVTGGLDAQIYTGFSTCGASTGFVNRAGLFGVVSKTSWDSVGRGLISSLGIQPTQFPIFLFYNVVMSNGPPASNLSNCCILGYHDSYTRSISNPGQTYGVADFEDRGMFNGISDVSVLSHEVQEWMNNPGLLNFTPPWGHVGQVSLCQNTLEEGDPLTGTLLPAINGANGFSYHVQEIPWFSWYFAGTGASLGVNNWFSSNNTFKGGALPCPPGGTN